MVRRTSELGSGWLSHSTARGWGSNAANFRFGSPTGLPAHRSRRDGVKNFDSGGCRPRKPLDGRSLLLAAETPTSACADIRHYRAEPDILLISTTSTQCPDSSSPARQTRKPSLVEGFVVWWVRGLGVEHPGFEPSPALPGETTASRSDAGPQGEPRQRRVIPSGAPDEKALPRGGLCRLVGSGTRSRTPWIRAPAPTPADRRPGVGGTGRVRRPATPAPAPTAARRAGRSRRAAIARSGRRRSARTETRRPG